MRRLGFRKFAYRTLKTKPRSRPSEAGVFVWLFRACTHKHAVRFSLKSGHFVRRSAGPLSATNGLIDLLTPIADMRCSKREVRKVPKATVAMLRSVELIIER